MRIRPESRIWLSTEQRPHPSFIRTKVGTSSRGEVRRLARQARNSAARLCWRDLPAHVLSAAEDALGSPVTQEAPQTGGYSPGVASRLTLGDGRRVFAKAVNAARNPRTPELHRREITVMEALPDTLPAPRLQWSYDDGDWVMLLLDHVSGSMPVTPWRYKQLAQVLDALGHLAELLTPAPIAAMSIQEDLADNFQSWSALASDARLVDLLSPCQRKNLAWLVDLESGWADAARGQSLLHTDLRADNLLLTDDGGVVVVDWPYAVIGAPWVDTLMLLPSVSATTSWVDLEQVWNAFKPARTADSDAVNAVLAALAGDLIYQSLMPAPQNVPGLRSQQRDMGRAALDWLLKRAGPA